MKLWDFVIINSLRYFLPVSEANSNEHRFSIMSWPAYKWNAKLSHYLHSNGARATNVTKTAESFASQWSLHWILSSERKLLGWLGLTQALVWHLAAMVNLSTVPLDFVRLLFSSSRSRRFHCHAVAHMPCTYTRPTLPLDWCIYLTTPILKDSWGGSGPPDPWVRHLCLANV